MSSVLQKGSLLNSNRVEMKIANIQWTEWVKLEAFDS